MIEAVIFDWVGTLYQFEGNGLFPYSERILKELQPKYKLAVISKAVSDNVETRLRQIEEIKHYFRVIIVDRQKNMAQYISCIHRMVVRPMDTLIVDDRMDRGIRIGNRLSCQTAWIQQGKYAAIVPNEETGQPTYRINSIEDLLTRGIL